MGPLYPGDCSKSIDSAAPPDRTFGASPPPLGDRNATAYTAGQRLKGAEAAPTFSIECLLQYFFLSIIVSIQRGNPLLRLIAEPGRYVSMAPTGAG